MARASSPVLRMKLLRTMEFVTPVWKLMPSAITSAIWLLVMVRLVIGPSNHMPTLVCWMYRPSIEEFDSAPPMPLT